MPHVHDEPPGALIHGFQAIRGPPPLPKCVLCHFTVGGEGVPEMGSIVIGRHSSAPNKQDKGRVHQNAHHPVNQEE